jgi:hypothetical protein
MYFEIVILVLSAVLPPRKEPLDPVLEICQETGIVTLPEGYAIAVLLIAASSVIFSESK